MSAVLDGDDDDKDGANEDGNGGGSDDDDSDGSGDSDDDRSDDDSDDEEANAKAMDLKGLAETDPEFFSFLQVRVDRVGSHMASLESAITLVRFLFMGTSFIILLEYCAFCEGPSSSVSCKCCSFRSVASHTAAALERLSRGYPFLGLCVCPFFGFSGCFSEFIYLYVRLLFTHWYAYLMHEVVPQLFYDMHANKKIK